MKKLMLYPDFNFPDSSNFCFNPGGFHQNPSLLRYGHHLKFSYGTIDLTICFLFAEQFGTPNKKTKSTKSTSSSISTHEIENYVNMLKYQSQRCSTRRSYYNIWKSLNQFFLKLDHRPTQWEDRLVLFIGHLIEQNRRLSTINSYVSAIRAVLQEQYITLNENKYLLKSLIRACRSNNDSVSTKIPVQKQLLISLIL